MEMNCGEHVKCCCWSCAKIADRIMGSVIPLIRTWCNLFKLSPYTSVNFQYTTMQNASHQILGF